MFPDNAPCKGNGATKGQIFFNWVGSADDVNFLNKFGLDAVNDMDASSKLYFISVTDGNVPGFND